MPSTRSNTLSLSQRPARLLAGSAVVVGALIASMSGMNAWADRGAAVEREAREHRGHGIHHVAHRHAGEGMHGGMMGGRMLERMLDDINATDAQRAQITKIQTAAREDVAKLHDQQGQLRQQTLQLLTAPTVDAAAVEKVRQQMLQQHDAASRRMVTAMVDSSKVLTPEQRATLATKFKERQERMEERRSRGHHGKHHEGVPAAPTKG